MFREPKYLKLAYVNLPEQWSLGLQMARTEYQIIEFTFISCDIDTMAF